MIKLGLTRFTRQGTYISRSLDWVTRHKPFGSGLWCLYDRVRALFNGLDSSPLGNNADNILQPIQRQIS